jgi:hypothetical protein
MADILPFRVDETERKRRLYEWADRILQHLGLIDQIQEASSLEDLRKITFDINAVAISLAVQEALHPESGGLVISHFIGLGKNELKQLIIARFNEAVKLRGQDRARGRTASGSKTSTAFDWTADLKLDAKTGAILPLLTNLILFLRHHPKWPKTKTQIASLKTQIANLRRASKKPS